MTSNSSSLERNQIKWGYAWKIVLLLLFLIACLLTAVGLSVIVINRTGQTLANVSVRALNESKTPSTDIQPNNAKLLTPAIGAETGLELSFRKSAADFNYAIDCYIEKEYGGLVFVVVNSENDIQCWSLIHPPLSLSFPTPSRVTRKVAPH